MELENIILSEVTQTQKDNFCIYSLISHKVKNNHTILHIFKEAKQEERHKQEYFIGGIWRDDLVGRGNKKGNECFQGQV